MKVFSLSASKIKSYKFCPFKFYIEYHLALATRTTFAAEQGSMVHVILEKIGEEVRDGVPLEETRLFSTWYDEVLYCYQEEGLWKLSEPALEREKKCKECQYNLDGMCQVAGEGIDAFTGCPIIEFNDAVMLVEKVLNDPGVNNPLNRKVLDVEDRFKLFVPDGQDFVQVNGIIDVVTELDKETIEIVDYKTGKHIQSWNECTKDPQLLIYHLAVKNKWHNYKNFMITIYYLRKKPLTLSFGPKEEIGTENALRHYFHRIANDESPRRRCDRAGGCINFDHVCKYMCDIPLCQREFAKFRENGFKILPPAETFERPRKKWLQRLTQDQPENPMDSTANDDDNAGRD